MRVIPRTKNGPGRRTHQPTAPLAGRRLLHEEMSLDFDTFLGNRIATREGEIEREQARIPALDIKQPETDFLMRVRIPGVGPADVRVDLSDGRLVTAESGQDFVIRCGGGVGHAERRFGSFTSFVDLPGWIDPVSLTAAPDNGIVTITSARQPSAPRRTAPMRHAGKGTNAPSVARTGH